MKLTEEDAPLARWLDTNLTLLAPDLDMARPGAEAILSRTTDVLFARVLRTYASQGDPPGWLGALRDARIAEALALITADPAAPWTVEGLARRVGMSRTGFHQRFKSLLGDTPASYLTTWRMRAACDLLDTRPDLSTVQIAEQVGYQCDDAFCNSFRRRIGLSPSMWRRRRAAG